MILDLSDLLPAEDAIEHAAEQQKEPEAASKRVSVDGFLADIPAGEPLFFDIETVPDYERAAALGYELPPVPAEVDESELTEPEEFISKTAAEQKKLLDGLTAPQSWIEKVIAAERAGKDRKTVISQLESAADQGQSLRKKLSLTPETLRIVSIAVAVGDAPAVAFVDWEDSNEARMLETFWELAALSSPLVGFNVIGFDLPAIFARSAILGARPTCEIKLSRYSNDRVCDLMLRRWGSAVPAGWGLKQTCKAYGIEVPAGDVEGSQVERLWESDREKLAEYAESDVVITRELWKRWRGLFC